MRRALYAIAAASLACASQQRTNDTGTPASTTSSTVHDYNQGNFPSSSLSPEQVRLVQRSLADRGFAVDMTGRYDSSTQQAVSDFQRARGIAPTGSLDSATVEALGIDPRDVMPVRSDTGAGGTSDATSPDRMTRDPNSQGSMNTPPRSNSSGVGTNDSTPTSPTLRGDLRQGTGAGDASGTHGRRSGHDADINPEGTLRPVDPGGSSSSGTGTNTGGPTAPTDTTHGTNANPNPNPPAYTPSR